MAKYPREAITKASTGKEEARVFLEKGNYLRYTYFDPSSGKIVKQGKETVLLKNEKGEYEQFFIIPIAKSKNFLIRTKNPGKKSVWDEKSKRIVDI